MLPEKIELEIDTNYELVDGSKVHRAVFTKSSMEELHGYSVTMIADTIQPKAPLSHLSEETDAGLRVSTIVARFPRCILSEVNTHRVFSRNSASSRARSIKVVIADVMEDPYVPVFTENQRGMGGPIVSSKTQAAARKEWLTTRDFSVARVLSMLLGRRIEVADLRNDGWRNLTDEYYQRVYLDREEVEGSLNLHKQNVNRLLEPYMWHEAVITSTEWVNFIQLRDHDEADPAIHAMAKLVSRLLDSSVPAESVLHAPFAGELSRKFTEDFANGANPLDLFKLAFEAANYSSGASAQVSYRPVADGGTGANPASLAERLLAMLHLSPFEHAAISSDWLHSLGIKESLTSNLSKSWTQHRALVAYLQESSGKKTLNDLFEFIGS